MAASKQKLRDKASVETLFARLAKRYPDAKTELDYSSPFMLLVAVVLSAQATDVSVNKATPALFKQADTPQKMLRLGEEGIKRHIKTIGLFNAKARNLLALCQRLVDVFDGQIPQTREELMSLPGVGRKTANVVLNEAFGHPTMAVDTHIFRVAHRLDLARGKTPDAVEEELEQIVPDKYKLQAHIWLILHGRYVCKARKPLCHECILVDLCHSADKIL